MEKKQHKTNSKEQKAKFFFLTSKKNVHSLLAFHQIPRSAQHSTLGGIGSLPWTSTAIASPGPATSPQTSRCGTGSGRLVGSVWEKHRGGEVGDDFLRDF